MWFRRFAFHKNRWAFPFAFAFSHGHTSWVCFAALLPCESMKYLLTQVADRQKWIESWAFHFVRLIHEYELQNIQAGASDGQCLVLKKQVTDIGNQEVALRSRLNLSSDGWNSWVWGQFFEYRFIVIVNGSRERYSGTLTLPHLNHPPTTWLLLSNHIERERGRNTMTRTSERGMRSSYAREPSSSLNDVIDEQSVHGQTLLVLWRRQHVSTCTCSLFLLFCSVECSTLTCPEASWHALQFRPSWHLFHRCMWCLYVARLLSARVRAWVRLCPWIWKGETAGNDTCRKYRMRRNQQASQARMATCRQRPNRQRHHWCKCGSSSYSPLAPQPL